MEIGAAAPSTRQFIQSERQTEAEETEQSPTSRVQDDSNLAGLGTHGDILASPLPVSNPPCMNMNMNMNMSADIDAAAPPSSHAADETATSTPASIDDADALTKPHALTDTQADQHTQGDRHADNSK